MLVRAAMVQFLLDENGFPTEIVGDPEAEIATVKLWRSEIKAQPGILFISEKDPPVKSRKAAATFLVTERDALAVLEAAIDALMHLQEWDCQLKDAEVAAMPLDQLIHLGEDVLPYVYAFYDDAAIPYGTSSNFDNWVKSMPSSHEDTPGSPGALSNEVMIGLFEDEDYHKAMDRKEPFYYESTLRNVTVTSYCLNVFDDDRYRARLVMTVPPKHDALPRGAEQIIQHFASYLASCLKRYAGTGMLAGDQNDALHHLLKTVTLDRSAAGQPHILQTFSKAGWRSDSPYCIVLFEFFQTVRWSSAAEFISRHLERQRPGSRAVFSDNSIVWLVNAASEDERAYLETLVHTVRNYACKAGISATSTDIAKLLEVSYECEAALQAGQDRDPHFWYYRFDDYALDYLLVKATETIPRERLASKKLRALMELDMRDDCGYVETLRAYFENGCNATHTARALFMHRTSLLRRLDRMRKLADIDFEDADEMLYLQLSLKLLA